MTLKKNRTELTILPVRCGDALHLTEKINSKKSVNLLIDGGYIGTYSTALLPAIKKITDKKEQIDLWVLTHLDADHINGALEFFRTNGLKEYSGLVKEIFFNFFNNLQIPSQKGKISLDKGIALRDLLKKSGNVKINQQITNKLLSYRLGNAKLVILSPDQETFKELADWWAKEEKNLYQPAPSIKAADPLLKDALSIAHHNMAKDPKYKKTKKNLINRSSIAFIYKTVSGNILFMGDALAGTIINSLRALGYSEKKPLKVKYIKLSHHGSKENFSRELLDIVRCRRFIVSSDGINQHGLPDKEVLAKIISHTNPLTRKKIKFFFNYKDSRLKKIFKADTDHESIYNFSCIYPKSNKKGIKLKL